jgi:hypothetical protein
VTAGAGQCECTSGEPNENGTVGNGAVEPGARIRLGLSGEASDGERSTGHRDSGGEKGTACSDRHDGGHARGDQLA